MYESKRNEDTEYCRHQPCNDVERMHTVTPETSRTGSHETIHNELSFGQACQKHQQTDYRYCDSPQIVHRWMFPLQH